MFSRNDAGILPRASPSSYDVLNQHVVSFSQNPLFKACAKSWAMYRGTAYHALYGQGYDSPYVDWDEAQQGKRPDVTTLGRVIVDGGAQFLFGQSPKFLVTLDADLEKLIASVCRMNGLEARLLPLARQCGNEGSIWCKFAWTPGNRRRPVALSFHSPYEVTAFRDPLDADVITLVRLQLKYQDPKTLKWYLYREEWSETEYTVYMRLETREQDDSMALVQMRDGSWPIDTQEANRFGVIPFQQIYNHRLASETDGLGDLWDMYPWLNQLSHTYWLQNRSNQWDGDPITVVLNAKALPDRLVPGDLLHLEGQDVDIKRLVPENNLREWMRNYASDVERLALDAVGADRINTDEITNKGNMTRQVMELLFIRSVKSTLEKRTNWGKDGLEIFFEKMLEGLSRLADAVLKYPALSALDVENLDSYSVVVRWPQMFEITPDERSALLTDLITAIGAGLMTRERAIEIAAELFGVDDVKALKDELADWEPSVDRPESGTHADDSRNARRGRSADRSTPPAPPGSPDDPPASNPPNDTP